MPDTVDIFPGPICTVDVTVVSPRLDLTVVENILAVEVGLPPATTSVEINAVQSSVSLIVTPLVAVVELVVGADILRGPKGEQGEQGGQGERGDPGEPGTPGAIGAIGSAGPQGQRGPRGEAGSDGAPGQQGVAGAPGRDGIDGANGRDGIDGADGRRGDSGPQGQRGPRGETGATGPQGVSGPRGLQGSTGAAGNDGATGAKGDQGVAGDQGPTGSQGVQGSTGEQGPQGERGINDGRIYLSTFKEILTTGQTFYSFVVPVACAFASVECFGRCTVPATLDVVLPITSSGSPVGEVRFAAGASVCSFVSPGVVLARWDDFTIVDPTPNDATLAGISLTFVGEVV